MKKEKSKRGGARPGSGRKSLYSEPLVTLAIRLPASIFAQVKEHGGSPWARQILIKALTKE